jgi:hypothetical protein
MAILDLPFSISPVVTGLMLVLLYGRNGWFAPALNAMGFNVVFAFPGSPPCSLNLAGEAAVDAERHECCNDFQEPKLFHIF